ncbi:MAG: leucyl aminopeptidase [Alphaproteobacteria bacterium]|nr:leucyl aminopeptidase [Alphaproteobacteria bacterium]
MTAISKEMVDLFKRELELCKVREGETVAVLSVGDSLRDYAKAFLTAAKKLGAKVIDVNLPAGKATTAEDRLKDFGKNPLADNPKAMAKLKAADLVIDLLVASFSAQEIEIRNAGPRMLLVCEDFEILKRLFPTPELRARTEAALSRLSKARTFRFTNQQGTDITYEFGTNYRALMEYGYVAEPGRWDHWPAGLVASCPRDGAVNGHVVMDEGDIIFPRMQFLTEPVEFVVEKGIVTKIKGGKEAADLQRWMEGYKDPRAYAVSHIGWGTHTAAEWALKGIGMDGRSYYGNVLFSLGPNVEFGGKNDTACHMDLPMRGCSAWLDGERIIANGRLLPDDLKAAGF